jgi:cellulose synthase/poly-beta-1,6-N-acetylglucosamine synthase-like glycosyltransferase
MTDRCTTLPSVGNRSGWPWAPPDDAGSPSDGATISIVLPSFNQGSYIEAATRSVLLQNYERIELVVMDGGSTDGSVDVIRKYARHLTYWRSERAGRGWLSDRRVPCKVRALGAAPRPV